MNSFKIINPYTLETIHEISYETLTNSEQKIQSLHTSWKKWSMQSFKDRATIIRSFSSQLSKKTESLATIIASDMGKPINDARNEIRKSIECCEYYTMHAKQIESLCKSDTIRHESLGVILGIMPWNFPIWQIIRFIIPTLMAGNTCFIKPALNTYRIAEVITQCFQGINANIVNIGALTNNDTEQLIENEIIQGVSLTGSLKAGQIVGALAAKNIKPCVLELGGSDPYIVFKDANLDTAASTAVTARFSNSGQTCISAKRFIIDASIYDSFLSLFKEKAEQHLLYGDPLDPNTTIGPISRKDLHTQLENQMRNANINSSEKIFKQSSNDTKGYYFPAHIIDGKNLNKNNCLFTEEIFGPIAVCQPFNSIHDAIELANQTEYGLGASIWTNNSNTIDECIDKITCGTIAINTKVRSQLDQPFGGRKKSGLGIELGLEGCLSFTGIKNIIR